MTDRLRTVLAQLDGWLILLVGLAAIAVLVLLVAGVVSIVALPAERDEDEWPE